jgi:hypothetical protein
VMDLTDAVFAEAAALESDGIQPVRTRPALGRSLREGKHVSRDRRSAADERVRSDAHEVMHGAQRAHGCPVLDDDMASQSRRVCHDYVITDDAVVRNVRVRHDQTVATDASQAAALGRSTIDGHILADDVVIPDLKPRGFTGVTDVLRGKTDGDEGTEAIADADFCGAFDHHVRDKLAAFADLYAGTHCAIWPDCAGGVNLCIGRNDCAGMNAHQVWCGRPRPRFVGRAGGQPPLDTAAADYLSG